MIALSLCAAPLTHAQTTERACDPLTDSECEDSADDGARRFSPWWIGGIAAVVAGAAAGGGGGTGHH
ncbi:hypothetical protein DBR34_01640, partial [Stenotrophomonas sp. HMWF003]